MNLKSTFAFMIIAMHHFYSLLLFFSKEHFLLSFHTSKVEVYKCSHSCPGAD